MRIRTKSVVWNRLVARSRALRTTLQVSVNDLVDAPLEFREEWTLWAEALDQEGQIFSMLHLETTDWREIVRRRLKGAEAAGLLFDKFCTY